VKTLEGLNLRLVFRSLVVVALVVGVLAVIALRAARETESAEGAARKELTAGSATETPPLPNPWAQPGAAQATEPAPTGELCGYGKVDPDALPPELEASSDAFILRQAASAQQSTDDGRKATGLAIAALISANAAERGASEGRSALCKVTTLCDKQAAEAFNAAAAEPVQAAIQLAIRTTDPRAYAIALRLCTSIDPDSPPPGCSALTVENWAQLDSGNALPWLLVAREARRRNDFTAADYALQRTAQAQYFDRRRPHYGDLLEGPMPASPAERTLVMRKLRAAEDERFEPLDFLARFSFLSGYCQEGSDATRQTVCSDIRRVLTQHSVDRLGFELGFRIPAPPGEAISRALETAEGHHPGTYKDLLDCASARSDEAWLKGVAKHGDLAYRVQLAEEAKRNLARRER
jgi:plasmid stability protein